MTTTDVESRVRSESIAKRAWASDRHIFLELLDGRVIHFSADRFRLLKDATAAQLNEVTLEVGGRALRWEKLDEDISVAGIVAGKFQLP